MRSEALPEDLVLRPAGEADAEALGELYLRAREAAFPAVPRSVHPPDEVRAWVRGRCTAADAEMWLAEDAGTPVALLLLEDAWVHSLYVDPDRTGQGIGSALLELACSLRPGGLGLYVFASNEAALRFYRRHGFGEVARGDGSENEEGEPDVELAWPDPGTLTGLRRCIDAVDDRLATVLEERATLTARVQALKEVPGEAGRDRAREREIAERMARQAPRLGADRLGRIIHRVITESLDAAEEHPWDG